MWAKGQAGPLSAPPPYRTLDSDDGTNQLGFADPMSQYANITAKQEGDGSYDQVGPATADGDHAIGKYQVMSKNIPEWTGQILGTPMTADQFKNSPQAQEAVYRAKMGEYVNKYGPEGAARAWIGGPGGVNNPLARAHRPDGTPFGPTVADYGKEFASKALAFNGQPQDGPLSQAPNPGGGPLAMSAPGGIPTPSMAPAMRAPNTKRHPGSWCTPSAPAIQP